jgi:hypothetical protein
MNIVVVNSPVAYYLRQYPGIRQGYCSLSNAEDLKVTDLKNVVLSPQITLPYKRS